MSTSNRTRLVALGFFGGFAAGLVLWSREQHARKRDLFSTRPMRRYAALSYLRGQRTLETARLLKDYIRWEQRADFQRRARRLLDRVERQLA
ncbi:MAG TPA: hypothetical protein VFW03_15495 [Gemmatimonadaceae bacterium]|nr:hypothetical protein [Gemmatimonadaceae bacterium]